MSILIQEALRPSSDLIRSNVFWKIKSEDSFGGVLRSHLRENMVVVVVVVKRALCIFMEPVVDTQLNELFLSIW